MGPKPSVASGADRRNDSGRRSGVVKLRHYIGGLEGLPEPLSHEPLSVDKRVFVEDWEKRIFGIHVAMMGLSNHLGAALPKYPIQDVPTTFNEYWTWADLRSGAEAMDPFDHFKFRYYERWLAGIAAFFIEKGYLSEEELASRTKELTADQAPPSVDPLPAIDEQIGNYLRHGDSPRRDVAHPKFAVGDTVRITNLPAGAHTPAARVSAGRDRHGGTRFRGRLRVLLGHGRRHWRSDAGLHC
jgi:nitrile hydratase subunit beta